MKMNLYKSVLLAVFSLVLLSQANICQAQRVGGFMKADTADKTVMSAANFAVTTKAKDDDSLKLVSILSAERQTVAGANYRVCMAIESEDEPQQAQATVYVNLKNVYSLIDWKIEKCAADDDDTAENEDGEDEPITFLGMIEMGKTDSAIFSVSTKTGDVAAYCFPNNSEAGRAILAACKNGEQCEFTGKVDTEGGCQIKDERELSASGKVISIVKVVRKKAVKGRAGTTGS